MKKTFRLFVALMAGAALLSSCVKEAKNFDGNAPVTIRVNIPEEGLAKVAVNQDASNVTGGMKTLFEATDVITVKNAANEAQSVDFALQSGAGTTSAEFKAVGGASALAGATSYNIYLVSNMPSGFDEQTQAADNSSAHLGFSVKLAGVNTYDGATFTSAWASSNGGGTLEASSVLRLRANMPNATRADQVQKVTIKSTSDLFEGQKEMVINITSPGVSGSSKVVTVFATLPAGDVILPSGTELLFQFQCSDDVNDKYTAYRKLSSAMTLTGGTVNSFNIDCPNILSYAGKDDDGSESKPYLIGDRHQLDKMRDELVNGVRKYFKMVDDVDLTGINWVPVSQNADAQADFNGNGHTINNLTISSPTVTYVGLFGLLYGHVKNLILDGANIDGGDKLSAFVMGRTGASSYAAEFTNVTVRNSTLTANNNYVGGLCGYVKKSNGITNCHIIDCSITNTKTGAANLTGGLAGWMGPNGGCTVSDSSVDRCTISGGVTNTNQSGLGGLFGRIEASGVVLTRCHAADGVIAPANANNVGGLVGDIATGTDIVIQKCYTTIKIQRGYTNAGGLVGRIKPDTGVTIDHCYSSSELSLKGGYGGKGGLVGIILSPNVTMKESIAWNSSIGAGHATDDASSGAVVGVTWPVCTLTKNYRKPGITYNGFYWAPSTNWDHADVSSTNKLIVLDTSDPVESEADNTTATSITLDGNNQPTGQYNWAYHGHRISNGAVVSPDDTYGWVSDKQVGDITVPTDTDPENPSYTGNNVWSAWSSATKHTIVSGVQYANFHGTWQSKTREINIVITEINSHNKLKIYYNYVEDGKKYLDEKCNLVTNAVAGTNGSMTSQFVRVDGSVKRSAGTMSEWTNNCALTIDGDKVDIVKVASNFEAATLPNNTVACAGPLLVWKGYKQLATAEWKAADTDAWLTTTHPRTAIGVTKDGKVIQVTVDGRWSGSGAQAATGMSTDTLAELMLELGCYKAMNFDGGGGSQMWVYGYGDKHNIVNHPHNSWPTYESNSNEYYWIKDNEAARRTTCCAVYVQSDLK
ncbi:MAG: phosphodiester glycosidase family protein [Bacteroidales bacterium]|nr:phosphodiester glycosidase family protein [Bacteroidales bacterium]